MNHPMTRHHRAANAALGVAFLLAISGCGKSESPAPAKPATPVAAAKVATASGGGEGGATAEEVARQARAAVACPAKIATPPRAEKAPVDDVVGVRPGLGYEEALGAVLCSHPLLVPGSAVGRGFNLKVAQASSLRQGFTARAAEPRVVKTSKQILREMQNETIARGGNSIREDLKPGQVKWFVGTMGLPGQERVLSVAREERFVAAESPTVASVTAALLKKYGPPTENQPAASSRLPLLRWAHDPLGRLVTETSPLFHKCVGSSDPDGGANLSPDCGLVVQAILIPQKDNPDLVDRMQVGVVDQAGGYRLISDTERALGQADQQRRSQEVERAAKNTKGPSL